MADTKHTGGKINPPRYHAIRDRLISDGAVVPPVLMLDDPVPLQLKCHETVSDPRVRRLLTAYVQSDAYRLAVRKAGAWRHDLDGNPVVEVSQDDRRHARENLRERARVRKQRLRNKKDQDKREAANTQKRQAKLDAARAAEDRAQRKISGLAALREANRARRADLLS